MQQRRRPRKNQKFKKPGSAQYPMRLNRFIANAGICSRRDADLLIEEGKIQINGQVVKALGTKVEKNDLVKFNGKPIKLENFVYVLLNKPKDYITTMEDTHDRRTVMNLVADACEERIYPVGRLDRNTTGLLLLTNDGELAQKLTHPKYKIKKIYQATLDKPITKDHLDQIAAGIKLEDGPVRVDEIAALDASKKNIGLEIHVGKNRIVRRIFEHFDYRVERLDRTMYSMLTKKELPRSKWRFLSPKEITLLKNMK